MIRPWIYTGWLVIYQDIGGYGSIIKFKFLDFLLPVVTKTCYPHSHLQPLRNDDLGKEGEIVLRHC